MSTRYLFVDSSKRDRTRFPNPANFQIPWGTSNNEPTFKDVILDGTPVDLNVVAAGSTASTIVFTAPLFTQNDAYNGFYVLITSGPATGQFRRILDYVSATATATVTPAWSAPIAAGPAVGTNYEIYRGRDNFVPLIYSGEQTTQVKCYSVQLLTLTIPNDNAIINSGNLAVRLCSNTSIRNTRILTSNNPTVANLGTFVVPVDDNSAPFLQLKNSRVYQTIKFRPDDDILFQVYFTTGPYANLVLFTDAAPPNPPNDLVQIQATFLMKAQPNSDITN